jgi:hypothetical protein
MIYTSENNWYSWQYGDDELFGRQTGGLTFKTRYSKYYGHVDNFGNELQKAAKSTLDYFPDLRPSILFSGGSESEIVLRTYINIGANPNVYIIRYEDDINIVDVSYAIAICTSLNIKYNLIDFNIKKFYENDAETISEQAQIDVPAALPQLKFLNYVEGLPIYCSGDQSWYRTHDNYNIRGTWILKCYEHDAGWSKYIRYINRPAIGEWLKWTPGLVLSYIELNWFKKLINDEYYGKLGVNSTKLIGYREAYPDLIARQKLTGMETIRPLIDEFKAFLEKKYQGLPYRNEVVRTLEELRNEITG